MQFKNEDQIKAKSKDSTYVLFFNNGIEWEKVGGIFDIGDVSRWKYFHKNDISNIRYWNGKKINQDYQVTMTIQSDGRVKLKSQKPLDTNNLLSCSMVLLKEVVDTGVDKKRLVEVTQTIINEEL